MNIRTPNFRFLVSNGMQKFWSTTDRILHIRGVIGTATPAERIEVVWHVAPLLARRYVGNPIRIRWHRLLGADRVIDRLESVGGRSDGTAWYRVPPQAYQPL